MIIIRSRPESSRLALLRTLTARWVGEINGSPPPVTFTSSSCRSEAWRGYLTRPASLDGFESIDLGIAGP